MHTVMTFLILEEVSMLEHVGAQFKGRFLVKSASIISLMLGKTDRDTFSSEQYPLTIVDGIVNSTSVTFALSGMRRATSTVMENWIRAPMRNGFHLRLVGCKKCSCHETVSRSDGRSQRKSAVTRSVNDCKFVCGKSDPFVRVQVLEQLKRLGKVIS